MTDIKQTTGQCNACKGGVYYDGLNWRHKANDRGIRDCPPPMSRPLHDALEDAIWLALDSEQGMPHSGVDPASVIPEFLRLLAEAGYAVTPMAAVSGTGKAGIGCTKDPECARVGGLCDDVRECGSAYPADYRAEQ